MMPLRSDARDLAAERLHRAADCVRVVGARVERGEDSMTVLRELVLARILLDEVRCVLTAHEAQICLAILTDSTYPIDVRRVDIRPAYLREAEDVGAVVETPRSAEMVVKSA